MFNPMYGLPENSCKLFAAIQGAGQGSTSNFIRRFAQVVNNGSHVQYVDDPVYGASCTVLESGLYLIYFLDLSTSGTCGVGISINATIAECAASMATLIYPKNLGYQVSVGANQAAWVSALHPLRDGDVIRPHHSGSGGNSTNAAQTMFYVLKLLDLPNSQNIDGNAYIIKNT